MYAARHERQDETWAQQNRLLLASQQVVLGLRNRPGYDFLTEAEFVELVYARLSGDIAEGRFDLDGGDVADQVVKIAKNVYATALYHGCASSKPDERERAYGQLSLYLYRVACNYTQSNGFSAEAAEVATQEALTNIHRSMDHVEHPGGFIGYCLTILRRECARRCRKTAEVERRTESLDAVDGAKVSPRMSIEMLDCLLQAVAQLPNKDWRMVLLLDHFAALGDDEIALVLGTTVGNVHLMRHRALQQLRNDACLIESLRDM